MIIHPASFSRFQILAESEAEEFMLEQFILSWQHQQATIFMSVHKPEGNLHLEISSAPPKELPSSLGSKIKKIFGD